MRNDFSIFFGLIKRFITRYHQGGTQRLKKSRFFIFAVVLVLLFSMSFALVACNEKGNNTDTGNNDGSQQEEIQYTASVTYTTSGIVILPGKDRPVYTATVRGVVVDEETGEPLISQLKIWDKTENLVYRTVTDYLGRYELVLPDGSYDIEFSHGSEYEIEVLSDYIVYTNGYFKMPDISLKRLYNIGNWYAGDIHQHSTYSDGKDLPSEVLKSNIAVGLSYGILSDHNSVYQIKEWLAGNNFYIGGGKNFIAMQGWEVTTSRGHYQAINCDQIFNATAYSASDILRIVNDIRLQPNTIAQINHPGRSDDMGFKDWNLAGRFDTIEVWNGVYAPPYLSGTNKNSYAKWVELMNKGTRLAIVGGTDNHSIYGTPYAPDGSDLDWIKRNTYSGSPRTFVYTDDYSADGVFKAIKQGNSFITNGPMVFADIAGKKYGETATLADNMVLNFDLKSNEELRQLKIFVNGKVVETIDIADGTFTYTGTFALENLKSGDWVNLQLTGDFGGFAVTNPIFIE